MSAPLKLSVAVVPARNPQNPDFFWVQRNPVLPFMGRFHAFPGGKVDETDKNSCVFGSENQAQNKLIFAGVREVFEETGVLLVENNKLLETELQKARLKLLEGELDFENFLLENDLKIDFSRFLEAGKWVTPEFQPMRFEASYFLVWLSEKEEKQCKIITGELVEGNWIKPNLALELWEKGEVLLSPPIIFVAKELAKGSQNISQRLKNTPKILGMPGKRIEFRKGIQLFPQRTLTLPPAEHTNCYLVGTQKLSIIDPASPFEEDQKFLFEYLENLEKSSGMFPGQILLTHHHPDHVGGVNVLKERYKIPVLAHEETAKLLQGEIEVDQTVRDGEILKIDGFCELEAVFTPGHAPGHLCFLEKNTGTFIVGDMISGFGTILISADHGGEMALYLKSLEKMLTYDFDVLLPAHGGSIGDAKGKIKQYLEHRLMRERKVLKAVQKGSKTFTELLEIAYDDTPKNLWEFAKLSLKAHLIKLKNDGKIYGFDELTQIRKTNESIYSKLKF
ncbi:MBL fold metallo-hydrolase [bacterium]|nr:MBL fold metallo-hydrolase [bacterium]